MYEICYKNEMIFTINRKSGEVSIKNARKLPFDIYLEESDDFDSRVNNVTNFNAWCSERILSLDRKYAKEVLNYYNLPQRLSDQERATIALSCRCLSINDCFWVREEREIISWEDVNLFENSLENSVLEVALMGRSLTITNKEIITPDLSTNGKAPKAWKRTKEGFLLLKGESSPDSVTKEVEASQILEEIGIEVVHYDKSTFNELPVSVCKCYTSQNINFARAGYFDIWCLNHDIEFADIIYEHKRQFDLMNLSDYLVGNGDEHPDNWGIIYDTDMNIIDISPIMDFDHAFEASSYTECQPARYIGLQMTLEEYAKSIISNYAHELNFNVDFSKYHYGGFVKDRINLLENYMREKEQKNMEKQLVEKRFSR